MSIIRCRKRRDIGEKHPEFVSVNAAEHRRQPGNCTGLARSLNWRCARFVACRIFVSWTSLIALLSKSGRRHERGTQHAEQHSERNRSKEHFRHGARRIAPACARIWRANRAGISRRLPARSGPDRRRFRRLGACFGEWPAVAAGHRHRLARTRPIRLRQESGKLQRRCRTRRCRHGPGGTGHRSGGLCRQFARRPAHHAACCCPSDRDRRRRTA